MEEKRIKLHRHQDDAIFSDERFVAIIAGLQSGKTVSGCIWSRIQFDEFQGDDGLIAAPTYKILSQSTLPKFFQLNPDLEKYHKKAESVIEVPGRGRIYIRSTENPNVLEGMTLRWAWLDEAGQMKLNAWINVQGRLSILKGKCFITTTPYAFNWLATDFYEKYRAGVDQYKVVQFKSTENPYFPREEFERVRQTMDPRTFQRRYEGLFTKMEGLVYDDFVYSKHAVDSFPPRFDQVFGGIDWGFRAPTAILVIGRKDDCFHVVDEFYRTEQSMDEILEQMDLFRRKWGVTRFYADSAEPDRIHAARTSGFHVIEADKDVEFGIGQVRTLIRENRLLVSRTCEFTLDEIEHYHYDEPAEGKPVREEPVKEFDHAMDAMRYALVSQSVGKPAERERSKKPRIYSKRHSFVGI